MIGRLVDRGKLRWTARLDQLLPDFAAAMRPEYRDVTLIELLSHFSGLRGDLADEAYIVARGKDPRPVAVQRLDYVRKGLAEPPEAAPRTKHIYSNTGFIIAAVIAERAGGKPYEQLMQDLVFRPLRIRQATFSQPGPGELTGHVDGRRARPEDANPSVFHSSGGVRMTMPDWAKFCVDQLNGARGSGKLLKPETYRILQTAYAPIGEIGPGNPHYGLGWEVAPAVMRRMGPVLSHSGSDGNWIADVWLFPDSGNGLLIATNAAYSMGADGAILDVFRELVVDLAPPRTDGTSSAATPTTTATACRRRAWVPVHR